MIVMMVIVVMVVMMVMVVMSEATKQTCGPQLLLLTVARPDASSRQESHWGCPKHGLVLLLSRRDDGGVGRGLSRGELDS